MQTEKPLALCCFQFMRKLPTLTNEEPEQSSLLREKLRDTLKKSVVLIDHISICPHRSTKTKEKSDISPNPSALLVFRLIKVLCWLLTKSHPQNRQTNIKKTPKTLKNPQRTNFESYEYNLSCTKNDSVILWISSKHLFLIQNSNMDMNLSHYIHVLLMNMDIQNKFSQHATDHNWHS